MHLSGIITRLLEKNIPMVCYRLPQAPEPVLLTGGAFEQLAHPSEAKGKKGFIVVPFDVAGSDRVLFFQPRHEHHGWNIDPEHVSLSGSVGQMDDDRIQPPVSISFAQYSSQATGMIDALKRGNLKKVVLSRVEAHGLPDDFEEGVFFKKLCDKYPHAFVSVFNDGQCRCWMGATPEMLLKVHRQHGQTVSLAATRAVSAQKVAPLNWKQKESLEQQLVTEYIRQILEDNQVDHVQEGPLETMIAGPVAHLRKSFGFRLPASLDPLDLAMALHPTPAVCGLPVHRALDMIRQTESHSRNYYSGFLGPVAGSADTQLFVNIRCMQLIGQKAFLYVGGGLLPASDVASEWLETEKKAETLLGMLQK